MTIKTMKFLNNKLPAKVWEDLEEFYLLLGITVIVGIAGMFAHYTRLIRGNYKVFIGAAFHFALWLTYSRSDPEYYDQNTRISLLFLTAFFYGLALGPFIEIITYVATLAGVSIRVNLSAAFYTIAIFLICTLFALTYPEGKYLWLKTPLKIATIIFIVLDFINEFYESRTLTVISVILIFLIFVFYIPYTTDYVVVGFKNGPGGDMDYLMEASSLYVYLIFLYAILTLFTLVMNVSRP